MTSRPIRILSVDDHAFLVEGLRARFEIEHDLECVGRLESAERLLSVAKELRPDIVLMDIEMPGPDPFEIAEDLLRTVPGVRVIFLSAYVRDHYISAAINAGAHGYFSKSDEMGSIIVGIRKVAHQGVFAFSPKVLARCKPSSGRKRGEVVPPASKLDTLSPREQEVLRMIGRGLSRIEIAGALCRSAKTIDGHREKIMEKLDIHDRGELVRFAIREGMAEV